MLLSSLIDNGGLCTLLALPRQSYHVSIEEELLFTKQLFETYVSPCL